MKQLCSRQPDPYNTVVLDTQLGWRSPWLHPVGSRAEKDHLCAQVWMEALCVTFGGRAGVRAAGRGHQSPT